MRYLVVIGIAVVTAILMKLKTKYRMYILTGFMVIMLGLSVYYNARILPKIMSFVRPFNQTFYQPEYVEKQEYPDSLLALVLKNKNVYVKNDYFTLYDAEIHNKNFMYAYYHSKNMHFFLDYIGANIIDEEDMKDCMVSESIISKDFDSLGYANDMFRYMFMYNDYEEEAGNYFNYYWYYYDYLGLIRVYVNSNQDACGNTVFDTDDIVILWDNKDGVEEEDIYIMTRDYYLKEVLNNE